MKKYPLSRKANLVIQEMENETLIYDLAENKAFCLNETAALVWQLCDGKKPVDEISEILGKKLNLPANQDIVWFAIDQLKKENLVENGDILPNGFAGMSRRQIIKKIGLGTMIGLPIVASLVAPTAAQSATGCSNAGTSCTCVDLGPGVMYSSGQTCAEVAPAVCGPNCVCMASNSGNVMGTCG